MFTMKYVFRTLAVLLIVFSLGGFTSVQAQTASSIPTGVSAADWKQIKGLLPQSIINTQEAYIKASNPDIADEFGETIAISGNTLVVGTNHQDFDSGAVYVFTRNGSTWSQQALIKPLNIDSNDHFGTSLAISGDTLVVGAPWESSSAVGVNGDDTDNSSPGSGAVYVFTRSGSTWTQQAYLKASRNNSSQQFGHSVAYDGNTIVVGAPYEPSSATGINGDETDMSADQAGAAYIFTGSGSSWTQQAYVKASNTEAYDMFGMTVGISGDTVVVGATGEGSSATGVDGNQADNALVNAGAAYVFTRSDTTWTQQAYLKASNPDNDDEFAGAISISADTIAIGALGEDSDATGINGDQASESSDGAGAVYIFTRSGSTWSQQAYVKASNTTTGGVNGYFGNSVAILGNRLAVGANVEASSATGIDGNQTNTAAPASGAVYLFTWDGSNWIQQNYLKASNTNQLDQFGSSVALTTDTVVVGAMGEDSNATGINGNQADNSSISAGAAYVFFNTPSTAVTFTSIAAQDGWVLESSETSNAGATMNNVANTFSLGDNAAKQQYRGILSFNTSAIPDTATITGVMLKVKKSAIVGGGNPVSIFQGFMADVKNGFFGAAALQVTDFQTIGTASYGPFIVAPVGNVYNINLTPARLKINKLPANSGLTQIRLRFKLDDNNNTVANFLNLFSGNATNPADRPHLVITYTP